MEIETTITKEGDVTVLGINGPINVNTSADAETCINKILEEENNIKLLIDLKEATFVSSSGIRTFLSISKKMKAKNLPLAFCSLNNTIQEVFSISGFDALVNVIDTREKALGFLASPS